MNAAAIAQTQRALELAIERAFFLPGTAAHFATVFSTGARTLHASDVRKIWDAAKDRGDIPRINRPKGGPKDRTTQLAAEDRA